jgi:hypothetical protein
VNDFPIIFDPLIDDPAFLFTPAADRGAGARLVDLMPKGSMIIEQGSRQLVTDREFLEESNLMTWGAPGMGKTHAFEDFKGRFIHYEYQVNHPYESIRNYMAVDHGPYIGERRVNERRKAKARICNRAARRARRAGR